jgi:hypothetical protein
VADHPALRALGLLLVCAVAALSALIELLLVPLYAGGAIVPVTIVFGLAGNVALPRLARVFVDRPVAMVAPFVCWLLPMVLLALTPRAEGDVLVRGGGKEQWVFYALLLGGLVAGIATVVLNPVRPVPPQEAGSRR